MQQLIKLIEIKSEDAVRQFTTKLMRDSIPKPVLNIQTACFVAEIKLGVNALHVLKYVGDSFVWFVIFHGIKGRAKEVILCVRVCVCVL